MEPAWIPGFTFENINSFPGLFPGLIFDTHEINNGGAFLTGGDYTRSDSACRDMEQHEITGLQTTLRLSSHKQALLCQALEHHRRTGLKTDDIFLGDVPHLYHALAFALIAGGIAVSSRR